MLLKYKDNNDTKIHETESPLNSERYFSQDR